MKLLREIGLLVITIVILTSFNNCSSSNLSNSASSSTNSLSQTTCRLRAGETKINPLTVDQVVELINRIEKPVTISCLISFLQSPLKIYAVNNQASAQPSGGPESPRIFIFNQNLILSVVPDGSGKEFVEMSEVVGVFRSIKAELKFPINDIILSSDAFNSIVDDQGATTCRGCHENTTRALQISSSLAFISDMILPNPNKRVPANNLLFWARNCNSNLNPYRCEMLKSLMIDGKAEDTAFLAAPLSQ